MVVIGRELHAATQLTMEYLEGVDLSAYLGTGPRAQARTTDDSSRARVLSSFAQLARGMHAPHQAGMLHRDLKPSNVLVVDHRVIVLDFGLVRELSLSAATVTEDGAVAGTPAYMAPEQLMGQELSSACDWYAFGAMLYEALSGLLPIDGSLVEILRRKLDSDPVPLHELASHAPNDVLDLCMALLRREPERRPVAEQIIAVLSRSPEQPAPLTEPAERRLLEFGAPNPRRMLRGCYPEFVEDESA